jgi:diguanylate cyclase (GGDEF)-like protein/PAS domain S-box-containing protein
VQKPVQIELAEQFPGAAQERKHAEEALRHFRAAMDVLADMIMLVDRATMRYIDINATACERQGYTREEMLRMGPQDVSSVSKEEWERAYDATIASGKTTRLESYHLRRDGTRFPVESCHCAMREGQRWIIVSIVRDISERIRAEQLQVLEHAVARSLADAEGASTVMTVVIRAICNTEGWECGRYFSVDEGAGVLRFSKGWGAPDPVIERFLRDSRDIVYAWDQGLVGKVWKSGQPLWTTDIEGDPRAQRAALAPELGIRGAFVFPVTSKGKTIGVLAFSSRKPREPDERLLDAIRVIGSQIGQFLQRRQAEEVVGESEERFRATFDSAPLGIMHTSIDGDRILHANAKLCEMLGYTHEELLGMTTDSFIHPDFVGKDRPKYRESMLKGEAGSFSSERLYVRKAGSTLWVNRIVSLARDATGKPLYFIRIIEDITERKRGEVERAQFAAIVESSDDAIISRDMDRKVLTWNAAAERMFGYTAIEVVGQPSSLIVPPDREAEVAPKRVLLSRGQSVPPYDTVRLAKDGRRINVSVTQSPIKDAGGRIIGVSLVFRDITERIQAARRRAMEHAVTQVLAESASVDEAMPLILQTICQGLKWACGAYWKWDATTELLHCSQSWHVDAEGVAEFIAATKERPNEAPAWHGAAPGTDTGGVVRRVWFSGAPAWFRDVMQQPDFRRGPTAAKAGLHSAFGFPILSGAQPLGVMEFYSYEIRQPDEALLQMVRAIGSQIGQFLQRKNAEDKLAQLAQFDTVTGLPNRYLFHDRLGLMLTQARRNNWLIGTLFVDLDRFKAVNDTYGHAAGDKLLHQVAARLKECVRGADTVGRLSGDEFAVVLSNLAMAEDAGLVAQKIVSALAAPFDLGGHQAYISASIGIALYPADGDNPDTLIKNADTAMYRAKQQGRNGYQFYLPEMNERLMQRVQLEAHLRGALERGEYLLHYQPKADLATGAITGFEALLRWRHGELTVSPAEFIPILEDTGLIVPVGEWVLRSVCEQIKRWEQQGVPVRPVAVNLSARQFQRENLAAVVGRVLEEAGVRPDLLELELTETLLMSDAGEAVQTLHQFKSLGVRLAMDDFGTGYSSLAYLKSFPLDALKIDRAFIRDVVSDPDDAAITIAIISLAHNLKLKVVAEGVETEEQLQFLRLHGCDEMQGFYFARPLPVEECTRALIEDRRLQHRQPGAVPDSPLLLLVDDNEKDQLLLQRTLAAEGFRVLTANSARAGLDLLTRHSADIVVSDQDMPEMTGVEFLSKVKKLYPKAVLVVVSGVNDTRTFMDAINHAGIHKFLSKNWESDRLRAEVREAYQQRAGGPTPS